MISSVFDSGIEQSTIDREGTLYPEYNPPLDKDLSTTTLIQGFRVGDCTYEFLRAQSRRYASTEGAGWECVIDNLSEYCAQAATQEEAFNELAVMIHTEFQRLLAKRPFEMDESERIAWKRLANTIDLLTYKLSKPLEFVETGCISFGKISRPNRVKWIDGSNYRIDADLVPGELMACRPGQWIECVVLRDRITKQVSRIKSFRKIMIRIPTEAQISRIWEGIEPGVFQDTKWE